MKRERTISQAIKIVLKDKPLGMTYKQIYQSVIDDGLYEFGAKNPEGALHQELRRHCIDINFPIASPVKYFRIDHRDKGKNYYALIFENEEEETTGLNQEKIDCLLDIEDELLPEEKMVHVYDRYLVELRHSLIAFVRDCHPGLFEKILIELLVAMGYGYDDKSGQVIGKSHNGGIDGIISEDKLGLTLIYIQAKRYNESNKVGRPKIQRFIGAMQRAEKGVFITTSHFTKEALDFANAETRMHIRLIDGETLVDLMIRYSIGLEKVKECVIYKINEDYFLG